MKDSDLKTISSNLVQLSERAGNETYLVCKAKSMLVSGRGWNLFVVKDGPLNLDSSWLHNIKDPLLELEFVKRFKLKKEVIEFLDKKEREKE
jgi:hypothetical protein